MCGRFELKTKFDKLPKVLKKDYPRGLDNKYETQNLIRPTDPVLVIKNEGKIQTTFMSWGFISPCLLYTSPSPRDLSTSRMPSSA